MNLLDWLFNRKRKPRWKIDYDGEFYYLREYKGIFRGYMYLSLSSNKEDLLRIIESSKFAEYHD